MNHKGDRIERIIKDVNEEGKWMEFLFEEGPLPGSKKVSERYDASSKTWKLYEAVEKAHLEEYIGRNGLNGYRGMKVTWEHDEYNWQIVSVALKGQKKLKEIQVLEDRISDALNVLDWGGENSKEFLMNKCLAVGGILRGVMTPADLRKEGFDIKKFKTERQMFEEAVDLFSKRHAAVLEELETMRKRRSDAVEIIEEKRVRIQELEKQLAECKQDIRMEMM